MQYGVKAMELVARRRFGHMVSYKLLEITPILLKRQSGS